MKRVLPLLGAFGLALAVFSSGLAQRSAPTLPILPDPQLTPGDALDVTAQDICVSGYTKKVRNVPAAVKRQAYANYGISSHNPGEFEVDHLISLELGGSNSIKNLWPQSYLTQPWNAHVKDRLENELHKRICDGTLDIKAAQGCIAKDWIACYKQTFNTAVPMSKRGRSARPTRGARGTSSAPTGNAGVGQVWVNTKSGKYFSEGSRYYGKTKEGKYMTEAEAKQQGYVAAKGH